MSEPAIGAWSFVVLLGLIAFRMPVGLAMFVVGSMGYLLLSGLTPYLAYMKIEPVN